MTLTKRQHRSSRKRSQPKVYGTDWGIDPMAPLIRGWRLPSVKTKKEPYTPSEEDVTAKYSDLSNRMVDFIVRYAEEHNFNLQTKKWEAMSSATARAETEGVPKTALHAYARMAQKAIKDGTNKGFTMGTYGYFREGEAS